ncbi:MULTISPECIES: FtsX-like permease family protein [unclassified Clostridioides]|uniref:FtsX-like permease family protein n=1 Tax=unclassified Clostridioides TaxID=2635829 RepID=UPI001D120CEB|nr:FtsX-like permease family protein [Clostridioides sp. ES-S-0049-03]MCC0674997.1 FtsX-like permease family protein [Clostridioides sp. ES-W-0018-02]MCC0679609.1 FtsX-like permease family protein [Clostridioides sp. ES-S-0005-03]MCC0710192.1 FtsX-like permease family protein [Clostridioides sp. ES-W-0017-02]UDN49323.1 FtsX-like permease family protein [Clostridioides sp. ES-S-0173-01]
MISLMKFAIQYIKHYKKQSISIILSIVLSVALLTGIGSLVNSANKSKIEKIRADNGDYHFYFKVDNKQLQKIKKNKKSNEYTVNRLGITNTKGSIDEPFIMNFLNVDSSYLDMTGRKLLKGKLPSKEGEIALDTYSLNNLNIKEKIGTEIKLDGKTYKLCGILSDILNPETALEGFVDSSTFSEENGNYMVYVKFDENKNIKKQSARFMREFSISKKSSYVNWNLSSEFGVKPPITFERYSVFQFLNSLKLNTNAIVLIIGIFSAAAIYSIFHVSILQRISQYGALEVLGANNKQLLLLLFLELFLLFIIGFPIGCILGIGVASTIHQQFPHIFLGSDIIPGSFFISEKSIYLGFLFLALLLILITVRVVYKLSKYSSIESMKNFEVISKQNREIKSIKFSNMTAVLSHKYMTQKKGMFIGILCSLALGGIIFLCSSYSIQLTRNNNELTMKADDGLNSDYQIAMQTTDFDIGIPKDKISRLNEVEGVSSIHPVRYFFGGIHIRDEQLLWKNFFKPLEKDYRIKNFFNGICTKQSDGGYLLKTNIYGYNANMLKGLNPYIIDGKIDNSDMVKNNKVIVRLPMDGTGIYGAVDIKPGDTIKVKVPKTMKPTDETIKFKEEDKNDYTVKEFVVAATVKRVMANNIYFIGDYGMDIVMTNEQMESNFNIINYNMASIKKTKESNSMEVAKEIKNVIHNIKRCIVTDYTIAIEKNNIYLNQKLLFIYGIVFVLLSISLFHIINTVSYLVFSRRHEFGILRAMGITDNKFLIMMMREGFLYGLYASIIMVIGSIIGQSMIYFIVKRVYLYINPVFNINMSLYVGMIILNITISIVAVIIPVKQILKSDIISEINRD